jgi:hypothetical protein
MSGKAPVFTWPQWVFKDLQVRGFNLHKWMTVPKGVSNSKARQCSMAAVATPAKHHFPRTAGAGGAQG